MNLQMPSDVSHTSFVHGLPSSQSAFTVHAADTIQSDGAEFGSADG